MLELGKEKVAKCLEVKIGEETYHIPLMRNLPTGYAKRLMAVTEEGIAKQMSFYFDFFGEYLGDALDVIDLEDLKALIAAWTEQGKEDGATLGE